MEPLFFLGVILGICVALLFMLFFRDFILAHFLEKFFEDVKVNKVIDPQGILMTNTKFLDVLEATVGFLNDIKDLESVSDSDKAVITHSVDGISSKMEELKVLITELKEVVADGSR